MARLIRNHYSDTGTPKPDILIPVPLHAQRIRRRGYNQALLLANEISGHLQIPVRIDACRRLDTGHSQRGLSARERLANTDSMFTYGRPLRLTDRQLVAIIDDVVTTGATLSGLAHVLRQNGARSIDAWALARRN